MSWFANSLNEKSAAWRLMRGKWRRMEWKTGGTSKEREQEVQTLFISEPVQKVSVLNIKSEDESFSVLKIYPDK